MILPPGRWNRFGRFQIVGCIGACVQLLVLVMATGLLRMPAPIAAPLSVEAAVLHNFVWHELYTWPCGDSSGKVRMARLWRFHISNGLVSLLLNTGKAALLVHLWRWPVLPSALATIAVCSVINFQLANRFVFR